LADPTAEPPGFAALRRSTSTAARPRAVKALVEKAKRGGVMDCTTGYRERAAAGAQPARSSSS